jgi:O-antigen ligase
MVSVSLYWEEIADIFRFERGLNSRDEIWATVLLAYMERPLFGWGMDAGWAMGWASAGEFEGSSAHSGYLHTLLRIGGVGALVVYGGLVYLLWWSFKGSLVALVENQIAWASVVLYLVNSIFRTYSFGGVGLLPIVAALGLSVILYRRKRMVRRVICH